MDYPTSARNFLIYAFTLVLLMFLPSCQYEFIEEDAPDPNKEYSFKDDILPIFEAKSCTSCHRSGSTYPDLTPTNAYNSIVPNLVNLSNPESSKIYSYPHPATTTHGFQKYSTAQANIILEWIKQGAINN
ncbi:MAG: hypothetical protein GX128_02505 [Bacteroidales bacterium]|jgi:hypothetical protein|nr:hypothetical protein [Bacteroidales bacterium]